MRDCRQFAKRLPNLLSTHAHSCSGIRARVIRETRVRREELPRAGRRSVNGEGHEHRSYTGEESTTPRPSPSEAAESLGCSRDFFEEHIGPELRWIRRGRLKLVSVAELDDCLKRSATSTGA
jgi:hypothetical protein